MLTLPIKKKWFDMILSGEKKEEYRTMSNYYYSRLKKIDDAIVNNGVSYILLRNGYSSNSPTLKIKITERIMIGGGKKEWGYIPPNVNYIIKINSVEEVKDNE